MKKKLLGIALIAVFLFSGGCGKGKEADTRTDAAEEYVQSQDSSGAENGSELSAEPFQASSSRDEVIVVMGPSSEPAAGFDPVYGWGAGEHVHEPLIQSTLTITNPDLSIGYDLATDMGRCVFYRRGEADGRGCGIYL